MSRVWITSDWHLHHWNCTNWRKGFKDHKDMIHTLVSNYESVVRKRDLVWFLGDICFDNDACAIIRNLPGDKRLVLGNHDTDRKATVPELLKVFTKVSGLVNYKQAWLSHAPIHPAELRGKFNIHGHVHEHSLDDTRYFNACVENTGYTPVVYQQVIKRMEESHREASNLRSPTVARGV